MARTINSDPFHNIRILWLHYDGLEVALNERGLDEGAAEEERLLRGRLGT